MDTDLLIDVLPWKRVIFDSRGYHHFHTYIYIMIYIYIFHIYIYIIIYIYFHSTSSLMVKSLLWLVKIPCFPAVFMVFLMFFPAPELCLEWLDRMEVTRGRWLLGGSVTTKEGTTELSRQQQRVILTIFYDWNTGWWFGTIEFYDFPIIVGSS